MRNRVRALLVPSLPTALACLSLGCVWGCLPPDAVREVREESVFRVDVNSYSMVLGPHGESVAVPVWVGEKMLVLRDGVPVGGTHDGVSELALSQDGRSLAFVASVAGEPRPHMPSVLFPWRYVLVKDGQQIGGEYVQISGPPVLSADGTSVACWVKQTAEEPERPEQPKPTDPRLRLLYEIDREFQTPRRTRDRMIVVRDGVEPGGESEESWSPVFSPEGRSFAFCARDKDGCVIVRDGVRMGGHYDAFAGSPVFSPDGRSRAFQTREGGKVFVVRGGVRVGGEYDYVGTPVFSANGRSVAFVAARGQEHEEAFVIKDGQQVGPTFGDVREVVLSADGTSVAFAATNDVWAAPERWFVVRDGLRASNAYEGVRSLTFSPDGRSLAFCAEHGDCQFVVKDGRRIRGAYDAVSRIETSRDGKLLVFAGVREGTAYRVEAPW